MEIGNAFGYAGGFLTISSSLFQLRETHRTKTAKNVSIPMFLALIAGQSMWIVNGALLSNMPVVIWNSVGICVLGVTVGYIYRIRSAEVSAEKKTGP